MNFLDYQQQEADLQKRQQLAEALQQSGLQPQSPQVVSGRVVPRSAFASIAPLLQTALGTYVGGKNKDEESALRKQRQQELADALSGYRSATPEDRPKQLDALTAQVMDPADATRSMIAATLSAQMPKIGDVDPAKFTPESLQKYATTGDRSVLVDNPAISQHGSTSPLVQAYQIAKEQGYTKPILEFQKDLSTAQANYPYTVVTLNGVPTLVDRTSGKPVEYGQPLQNPIVPKPAVPPAGAAPTIPNTSPPIAPPTAPAFNAGGGPTTTGPRQIPLTTLKDQAAADAELARQKAAGGGLGEAQGKIAGGIQSKASNAQGITGLLDEADKLIDTATGSKIGAAVDAGAAIFGASNPGAEAISKLKVLQAGLMLNQPRMEGPQSDKDVQLYREAAASIGDPGTPNAQKKAALGVIRTLNNKYQERGVDAAAPAATGVPALTPAAPATAAPTNTAPAPALEYLKQHPEFADAFKAKYGYLPGQQ